MAVLLVLVIERKIPHEKRSGTDDAHIALEDVYRLGELVERGFSEEFSELGEPYLVGEKLAVFVLCVGHCAEFVEVENLFVLAWPLLPEKHGASELYPHKHGDNRVKPAENDKSRERADNVKRSLYALFINAVRDMLAVHKLTLKSEAALDYFDNNLLLFLCHFDIAGQAHTAFKDIRADVPAVLSRNKVVVLKNRLQVHWLPDRSALCVVNNKLFENFRRTGLSVACYKLGVVLRA